MKRIVLTVLASVALVTGVSAPAQAAVSSGNTVYNMGRDYDVSAQYYNGSWWNLLSGYHLSQTQCVKPHVYMVSQWGGGYAAGVTRCFSTSNNTLKLYRFGEGPA